MNHRVTLDDDDDYAPVVTAASIKKVVMRPNPVVVKTAEPKKPRLIVIKKKSLSSSSSTEASSQGEAKRIKTEEAPKKKPFVPYVDDPNLPEIVRVSIKTPKPFDYYVCGCYRPKNCDLKDVDPKIYDAPSYPFVNPYYEESEEIGAPKYEEHLRRTCWKTVLSDMALKHLKDGRRLKLGCWCDPRYPPDKEGRWCHAKIVARLVYERKQIYEGQRAEAARYKALCVSAPRVSWRSDDPQNKSAFNEVQMSYVRKILKGNDVEYDEAFYEKLKCRLSVFRAEEHETNFLEGEALRILLVPFYEETCFSWLVHPYGKNPFADLDKKSILEKLTFASGPSRPDTSERGYIFEVSLFERGPMRTPAMIVNFSYAEKAEAHEKAKLICPHALPLEATASDDFDIVFMDEHDSYVHECSASPASKDHAAFMTFLEDAADSALETMSTETHTKLRNALIDGLGARFYASTSMGYDGSAQDFFEGSIVEFWFDFRVVVRYAASGGLFFRPFLKITRAEILKEAEAERTTKEVRFETSKALCVLDSFC